jgi:hypothetical protein
MSRSRRKTSISGITTAESEAEWKAKAARRSRHAARQALTTTLNGDLLPTKRWAVVNPWDGPKDGKSWFRKADYPGDMRK